jgi:hypothetical protein
MLRMILGLALCGAAACIAVPAAAQTYELGRYGLWRAYEGRSANGTPVCGISTAGRDRSVHIKYFQGQNGFDVQIYDENWNIPNEVPVRVAFELGTGYRSQPLNARGYPRNNRVSAYVELGFAAEGSNTFWTAFRAANEGRLLFLTGTEGAWRIGLAGSNAAASAMAQCIDRIGAGGRRPFDAAPAPRAPTDTTARQPFDPSRGPPKQ